MKIAVTSKGNSIESKLDQRFGRCSFFFIYDTSSGAMEFIPNPGKESREGAGPVAVKLIADKGVKRIISGEFGIKIKSLLDSLGIQMIILNNSDINIDQIVSMLKEQKGE